jgi:hypothetical protein
VADPDFTVPADQAGYADVDWDRFDSVDYFEHNYRTLLREDAEIIQVVADYFAEVTPGFLNERSRSHRSARAVDVGSGTNLYPAMTMLPFSSQIVRWERAHTNQDWLRGQLQEPAGSWDRFWRCVRGIRTEYGRIADAAARDLLGRFAAVVEGDLFALQPDQYDMGTMFFVAESITSRPRDFEEAIRHFIASLVPRAPFAMAFMRESSGWEVGGRRAAVCRVTEADDKRCLSGVAAVREIRVVDSDDLRAGYRGMIVAVGRRR